MVMIAGAPTRSYRSKKRSAIAERFPRGRLVICEKSGHLPMMEEPALLTRRSEGLAVMTL